MAGIKTHFLRISKKNYAQKIEHNLLKPRCMYVDVHMCVCGYVHTSVYVCMDGYTCVYVSALCVYACILWVCHMWVCGCVDVGV